MHLIYICEVTMAIQCFRSFVVRLDVLQYHFHYNSFFLIFILNFIWAVWFFVLCFRGGFPEMECQCMRISSVNMLYCVVNGYNRESMETKRCFQCKSIRYEWNAIFTATVTAKRKTYMGFRMKILFSSSSNISKSGQLKHTEFGREKNKCFGYYCGCVYF